MSVKTNDAIKEDSENNNTTTEQRPIDNNQIKVNNMLKDRLRKYIRKLDGKIFITIKITTFYTNFILDTDT